MTPSNPASDPETPTAVRRTYDRIAEPFARTREHPWPEVTEFLTADRPPQGVGLDLGCGNGRHLAALSERVDRAVGVDLSRSLLSIADERVARDGVGLLQGEATRLPLSTESVDLALYVATLHHLAGRRRRLASLDELARVLAPGGRALVSVWSTEHDRFADRGDAEEGFDATIDWTLPDGDRVPRFYHIYAPREFEADLAASALGVERAFVSSGNCYAVVTG